MAETKTSQLRFDSTLSDVREQYVGDRLMEFNRAHSELWDQNHDQRYKEEPLHVWALDQQDEVVGGLVARTHRLRSWLEIVTLWVREDVRGRGIGREMMSRMEAEARARDCLYARTATDQALGFYLKCGYLLYGKLDNCPPGETAFYVWKDLQQKG